MEDESVDGNLHGFALKTFKENNKSHGSQMPESVQDPPPALLSVCSCVLQINMFKTMYRHAKKHPGLIPQFLFMFLGISGAALYLLRLARGPHVSWDCRNNPEPWNKLGPTYQYKLVAVTTDYKRLKKEGPDF